MTEKTAIFARQNSHDLGGSALPPHGSLKPGNNNRVTFLKFEIPSCHSPKHLYFDLYLPLSVTGRTVFSDNNRTFIQKLKIKLINIQ